MARHRSDSRTADLLSWVQEDPVQAFEGSTIHAATLTGQLCRGLKETLKDSGRTREQIAQEMADFLDEAVSENMLNAYVSEARSEHIINVIRFVALIKVTRDPRLLNWIAEMLGMAVIETKYLPHIAAVMLDDKREEIERRLEALRREIKSGGKS